MLRALSISQPTAQPIVIQVASLPVPANAPTISPTSPSVTQVWQTPGYTQVFTVSNSTNAPVAATFTAIPDGQFVTSASLSASKATIPANGSVNVTVTYATGSALGAGSVQFSAQTMGGSASDTLSVTVENDIASIVGILGNSRVIGIRSVRYGVTSLIGLVSAIADARGSGPTVVQATQSLQPTIGGAGPTLFVSGTGTQWMQSLASAVYDQTLNSGVTVYFVGVLTAPVAGNFPAGVASTNVSNQALLVDDQSGGYYGGFSNPNGTVTPLASQSLRTPHGKIGVIALWRSGGNMLMQCYPSPAGSVADVAPTVSQNGMALLGTSGGGSNPSGFQWRASIEVQGAPNAGDVAAICAWARQWEYAVNGAPTTIIWDGDSITFGQGLTTIGSVQSANFATLCITSGGKFTPYDDVNLGIAGQTLATMVTNTNVDTIGALGLTNTVLHVLAGVNDIAGNISAANLEILIQQYCSLRRTGGMKKIAVATVLPANSISSGADENVRLAYNTWLRGNYASFADALVDLASDTLMGQTGQYTNSTYYQADGIHPTAAGHARLAAIIEPALAAIL